MLIICEKLKSALRIASILSAGKFKTIKFGKVPVYSFKNGEENFVLGLKGHILSLDYPSPYTFWGKTNLKDLIHVQPERKILEPGIVRALEQLAKRTNTVIIATDYDREGELIGVEALEPLKKLNPDLTVKRAKFSALTQQEVKRAFNNLSEIDYNLSSSAEARQLIDLLWGAVLTRFISLASECTGKDFLSAGRVQSPTLRLIVDREKEIRSFRPKPYWELGASCELGGKQFSATRLGGKFWSKAKADSIFAQIKGAETGRVLAVEKEKHEERPPAPFNTTSFLQACSALRISASRAMALAEELYQSGLISYPRTDNTVYPKSLNLRALLKKLLPLFPEAEDLFAQKVLAPTRGKKFATDHPPIHPVDLAKKDKLAKEAWVIYELVARRFFATLAPSSVSETLTVKIDINNENFGAFGYKILEKGWRKYYPYLKVKETLLPELRVGELINIVNLELQEKHTKPPKRYSQGSLIQLMESFELGTKSTRHEILRKLYQRNYIHGISPVPTTTGHAVTEALETYAARITSPKMTSALEKEMDEIAEGKKDLNEVVSKSQELLEKILEELEANKLKIGELIKKALREQNVLGTCPVCNAQMIIIRSKRGKRFAGCTNFPRCQNSYPLPARGRIIPLQASCEFCKAPKVRISIRRRYLVVCINPSCPWKEKERAGRSVAGATPLS